MKVVVAVREISPSRAQQWLTDQACEVIKSRLDTQEPALRNLVDGLYLRGLKAEQGGLFWFLVEAELNPAQWLACEPVSVCFAWDWLTQQARQIRYLKGLAYCDAAAGWAQHVPFDDVTEIHGQSTGVDWQGFPVVPLSDADATMADNAVAQKCVVAGASDESPATQRSAVICADLEPPRFIAPEANMNRGATPVKQDLIEASCQSLFQTSGAGSCDREGQQADLPVLPSSEAEAMTVAPTPRRGRPRKVASGTKKEEQLDLFC